MTLWIEFIWKDLDVAMSSQIQEGRKKIRRRSVLLKLKNYIDIERDV